MQRTNIYLEEEQCAALDAVAEREGTSRAAVIRDLIDRGLGGSSGDFESDIAAIRESFGALDEFDGIERGSDERAAHLDRLRRKSR